jgi:hypothetical protein
MLPEINGRHQGFAVGEGRVQTDAFPRKISERASKSKVSAHASPPQKRRSCEGSGAPWVAKSGMARALRRDQAILLARFAANAIWQKVLLRQTAAKHWPEPSA